jgi:DNA-binding NarL/FixJ family response regulator
MKPIRILIADDHALIRSGLRTLLAEHQNFEVCGEARDGREAVNMAAELQPQVVILDINMPALDGLQATREIRQLQSAPEILVISVDESEQLIHAVLEAGARGYVLKSDAPLHIISAIEALAQSKPFFTGRVSEIVLRGFLKPGERIDRTVGELSRLSAREREILRLLASGNKGKEVAAQLDISAKTVEAHRANIMRKHNLRSIADLVLYAIRHEIIPRQ